MNMWNACCNYAIIIDHKICFEKQQFREIIDYDLDMNY